jgi:predicted kinase
MPTLYLMVGLPCSGKTTLARKLEREKSALRYVSLVKTQKNQNMMHGIA